MRLLNTQTQLYCFHFGLGRKLVLLGSGVFYDKEPIF
jgi:hypothetical protein